MAVDTTPDAGILREQVRHKYGAVARDPRGDHHFHTGRRLAAHLGYPAEIVDSLPGTATESFAGVGNPFSMRTLLPGERVVDVGCGAGLDTIIAAHQVTPEGSVVGVDMTDEMLAKARDNVNELGLGNAEIRRGLAEEIPVEDGWADAVISNGVFNLCPDKRPVFAEVERVLAPGGWLQFADIANGRPVPPEALQEIDLWTG
ncbi:MAG TPA: methyltransferase domain-containing protein [Acidimicrobiales bacterium]|nr:methyltransferase domain-containing protein [Acidimicrobiales bacterium]